MNVLFCCYENINYETRAKELLQIMCKRKNNVFLISEFRYTNNQTVKFIPYNSNSKLKLINYWATVIKSAHSVKPDIVVLRNNYSAILLPILKMGKNKMIILYDSAELYISGKINSMQSAFAAFFRLSEKLFLRKADIVLAANQERAKIMTSYYKLKETPFVFDNAHRIFDKYDAQGCEQKYKEYLKEGHFTIFYSGGLSDRRQSFDLAEAVANLGYPFYLLISGTSDSGCETRLFELINHYKTSNIVYLGLLPLSEVKYLNSMAAVTVSLYSQDTINNKYCASGKIYESLLEGTPIITSTNPPLQRICNQYNVGISSDDLKGAIENIYLQYNYYKNNAIDFARKFDAEKRISLIENYLNEQYYNYR